MSAATEAVKELAKRFLTKHPSEAYRPVPLAKAIGEKDIRRVRAALKQLKDEGEVVTCTVYRADEPADEEFRIVAGGRMQPPKPYTGVPCSATREREVATPPAAPAPVAPLEVRRRRAGRRAAPRQQAIVQLVEGYDAPMTARDIIALFRARGETELSENAVCAAICELKASGGLVVHTKIKALAGPPVSAYATPALAARLALESNTKGSDGETTPPEHAATGEAGEAPAAPREATAPAPQKTVQIAPEARAIDARGLLEAFFIDCDRNWYTLSWLVRMAGGDVPDTLKALAQMQRDGKLRYAEADRAPIWSPVEGFW